MVFTILVDPFLAVNLIDYNFISRNPISIFTYFPSCFLYCSIRKHQINFCCLYIDFLLDILNKFNYKLLNI